ncbi:MAG: HAD family hydrolase [Planctomycetes bacterium]|nr:HAD family hydrolase [Planctomycetota bacterium]
MKPMDIQGVIFDMDGTLVQSDLDFRHIREEAEVPVDTPILEYVASADFKTQQKVLQVLEKHEKKAALTCELVPEAKEILHKLKSRGYPLGLLTRNSRHSVTCVIQRFALQFDCWITREDADPKPSPEPVRKIASIFNLRTSQLLLIGDYVFDIQAGNEAGAFTALLKNQRNRAFAEQADIVLETLGDLFDYLPDQSVAPGELP